MNSFPRPWRRAEIAAFVYEGKLGRSVGSYSKIKVVRYHTMDSADSPQNSDAFGHEKAF